MTPYDLKALLATIERGWVKAENYSYAHTGEMGYARVHEDITEGRQATAALVQHVERMEAICDFVQHISFTDPYDYAEDEVMSFVARWQKEATALLETLAVGQPDNGANGEANNDGNS